MEKYALHKHPLDLSIDVEKGEYMGAERTSENCDDGDTFAEEK